LPDASGKGQGAGQGIRFRALDGYDLGGLFFPPSTALPPSIAVVLVGGGGVPAARYANFAAYLAAAGIPVLAFDYRGIATSRPARLRGLAATAEDWSECDCGGAIAWMRARYPAARLAAIAHSIGTLLIGGAPNVGEIRQFVFIGAHTGYYGDYLRRHRLPMALVWHGVMPALTRMFGYFPARWLALGEDIPAGIALQWAARRTSELRPEATDRNAARARAMLARYAAIRVPTDAISLSDDAFATEAGCTRLLSVYPGIAARREVITPDFAGFSPVGHFGFFRRAAQARLWPLILTTLRTPSPHADAAQDGPPAP
jgi:predicted alpha/beta hydrolase